jgi:hypothetical protein
VQLLSVLIPAKAGMTSFRRISPRQPPRIDFFTSVLSDKQREEIPDGFRCETRREEEPWRGHGDDEQRRIAPKDTGIV